MKLLFDQNISFRIIKQLENSFPESKHVNQVGLENSTDAAIWDFARINSFIIVTFDADFYDLALLMGVPPKIIWLRIGNASTLAIVNILMKNKTLIKEFALIENNNVCLEIF